MKEIEESDKYNLIRWEDALSEEHLHDQEIMEKNNQEYKVDLALER